MFLVESNLLFNLVGSVASVIDSGAELVASPSHSGSGPDSGQHFGPDSDSDSDLRCHTRCDHV